MIAPYIGYRSPPRDGEAATRSVHVRGSLRYSPRARRPRVRHAGTGPVGGERNAGHATGAARGVGSTRGWARPTAGGQARFVKLDVTSEADWQAAVKATVTAFGKLELLVNNAGISGTFDPDTTSTAAWDTLMNVNAKGVFLGMKHAVPAMREAGGGAIVNISSISGFVGQDRIHMGYSASKGAVRIMTRSAAVQYSQDGRRIDSGYPGLMPPMRTSKVSADPEWR